jgi:hypothetical protein
MTGLNFSVTRIKLKFTVKQLLTIRTTNSHEMIIVFVKMDTSIITLRQVTEERVGLSYSVL